MKHWALLSFYFNEGDKIKVRNINKEVMYMFKDKEYSGEVIRSG